MRLSQRSLKPRKSSTKRPAWPRPLAQRQRSHMTLPCLEKLREQRPQPSLGEGDRRVLEVRGLLARPSPLPGLIDSRHE